MFIVPALSPNYIKANNARLAGTVEHALSKAKRLAYDGWTPKWSEKEFILKPTADLVVTALRAMAGKAVAFDVETDGRHSAENTLRCVGFYDGKVGVIVPLLYRDGTRQDIVVPNKKGELEVVNRAVWKKFFTGAAEEKVLQAMRDLLSRGGKRAAKKLYTQNGQYDRQVMRVQTGIDIAAGDTGYTFDTILAHHVMCPYLPHRLGIIAALMTDAPYYKANEDGDAWSSGTDLDLWRYCVRDCKTTWLAAELMEPELARTYPSAARVFEQDTWQEDQCEQWKAAGVELDPAALRYFKFHYTTVRDRALEAMRKVLALQGIGSTDANFVALLDKLAGKADVDLLDDDGSGKTIEAFNPGSLIELRMMLAGLRIPLSEVTATGQVSTAKEILTGARKELLAQNIDADDPRIAFLDYLFAWRESAKVIGTYLYPEVLRTGRVHPTFNVHIVPTGRLSSNGPNCFSGDTELLTPSGWVRIDQWVKRPIAVAQWNEGNTLEWADASQVIKKESSDWVHIKNEHIDLRVTGDHRCPLFSRRGKLKVVEAHAYPEDHKQVNAVRGWRHEPDGLSLTDNALQLLIAVQADGSWTNGALDFTLAKPRKVERLRALLTAMGQPFTERLRKPDSRTGTVATRFYVAHSPVLEAIMDYLGTEKLFGPWVLRLNATQRAVFMKEVMLWDGCAARMNHYASAHESNAAWVQTVFVLSGHRTNTRVYRPKPNAWGSKLDSHQVDVSHKSYSWTTNRELTQSSERAPAYCLTVPSSFVLVRRSGKVMVSGQCQNQPAEIRGMYVARKDHGLVSMDWDALEMREGAFLSQDPAYIKVFKEYDAKTGPKPHHANMSAIFGLPATKAAAEQNPGMYRAAKVFAYAVAYGAGEDTVFEKVREELPDMQWKDFLVAFNNYKAHYPKLFAFQREVVRQGTRLGYIDSGVLGRRMFFFERAWGESSPEATMMQNAPYQCYMGGMRALTINGYQKLEDLAQGGANHVAWSGQKWVAAKVFKKGTVPTYRVTLKNGVEVEVDATHGFLTEKHKGHKWTETTKLKRGMRVALDLARPLGAGLTENASLAWMTGFYVGNGWTNTERGDVTFVVGDSAVRAASRKPDALIPRLMETCAQHGITLRARDGEGCAALSAFSNKGRTLVKLMGIDPAQKAATKRIPEWVWGGSLETRAAFITGLLDADGTVGGDKDVRLQLCQRELLQEVWLLARTCGVTGAIYGPYKVDQKNHKAWVLCLNSHQTKKHLNWGLGGQLRTQQKVPPRIAQAALEGFKFKRGTSHQVLMSRIRGGGSVSPYTVLAMGGRHDELYDYTEVVSVKRTGETKPVFTLSMLDAQHRYVGEGLIAKNSTGSDIVGLANRRIMERLVKLWRKTKLKAGEVIEQLAQVHDELVFEVPLRLIEEFCKLCKVIAEEKPKDAKGKELDWNLPVDIHWSRRWKPVQARCGHVDAGERCRELVDVEVRELKTKDVWEGKCSHGHEKRIEVPKAKAA